MNRTCAMVMALILWIGPPLRAEAPIEQKFTLNPGWNSIYLQVAPEPNDTATVFAGIPIISVWTRIPRTSSVEYIRDPSEGVFNLSGWLSYFSSPDEAPVTNLFAIQPNRAYLVNLGGDEQRELIVTGRPSLRDTDWIPESFNYVGFPVDDTNEITFASYFAPSKAHAGQAVYRVPENSLEYSLVPVTNPGTETINAGEAYWSFCHGASNYTGPLAVDVDLSDGLDFGGQSLERDIRIDNLGGGASATLRTLPSDNPVTLSYFDLSEQGNIVWKELPSPHTIELPDAGEIALRLAVRRTDFTADSVDSVLELSDGAGLRRLIPVHAQRRETTTVSSSKGGVAVEPHRFAGLWVGSATVTAVSEAQNGSVIPTPTATEFGFRLIVHVDAVGQARLLKQVTQMWEDGELNDCVFVKKCSGSATVCESDSDCDVSERCDPESTGTCRLSGDECGNGDDCPTGTCSVSGTTCRDDGECADPQTCNLDTLFSPGRLVLLTDDQKIVGFKGAGLRDGQLVGYRMSTVAYDFEGTDIEMTGPMDPVDENSKCPSGPLTVDLDLPPELPTHPFKHRFHPDHDNLDAQFDELPEGQCSVSGTTCRSDCECARSETCNLTGTCSESGADCNDGTECDVDETCNQPRNEFEAFCIRRNLELQFSDRDPLRPPGDPEVQDAPDWCDTIVGGTYREEVTGLHRHKIVAEGTFRLRRVSEIAVLNE